MAITTEDKRRSATSKLWDIIYPVADGDISKADRRHIAGMYRFGIVTHDAAMTLALSSGISQVGQASIGAALTLNQLATVADGGQATSDATSTLAQILTTVPGTGQYIDVDLSLAGHLGIAGVAQAITEAGIDLSCIQSVTQTATITIITLITPDCRTVKISPEN